MAVGERWLAGARALAALAARADVHLHLEEAAVAGRQHLGDRAVGLVRVLDGDRLAEEVREGDGHPLEDGGRSGRDALDVLSEIHRGGFSE